MADVKMVAGLGILFETRAGSLWRVKKCEESKDTPKFGAQPLPEMMVVPLLRREILEGSRFEQRGGVDE